MILLLFMNALFALTFPLGKLAVAYAGPLILTGVRMLLAGIILFVYNRCSVESGRSIARSDVWLFMSTTFFYVYLAFVPEFWALEYLPSLKANLLWSLAPFVSAVLGYLLLGERLSNRKLLALAIGMISMIPIFLAGETNEALKSSLFSVSLPELALIVAIISTSYAWFLVKRLLAKGYALEQINSITMFWGGIFCLITAVLWKGQTEPLYTSLPHVLGYSLALVLVSNILAYKIYGMSLKRYTVTFLNFTGFLCPVFGAFFAKLFFNEVWYPLYGLGFAGIMIGLVLFYRDEVTQETDKSLLP